MQLSFGAFARKLFRAGGVFKGVFLKLFVSSERKVVWTCFYYSVAFEAALLFVAFKTTRNGFRIPPPQTEGREN